MQAGGEIEKLTSPETAGEPDATVAVKKSGMAEMVYGRTPEFVFSTVLLLILLYFLLAYDEVFLTKLIKLMPRLEDKKNARSRSHIRSSPTSRVICSQSH